MYFSVFCLKASLTSHKKYMTSPKILVNSKNINFILLFAYLSLKSQSHFQNQIKVKILKNIQVCRIIAPVLFTLISALQQIP